MVVSYHGTAPRARRIKGRSRNLDFAFWPPFIEAMRDPFLQAAIDEAKQGLAEGGIPIGSVIVHRETIIGRGFMER